MKASLSVTTVTYSVDFLRHLKLLKLKKTPSLPSTLKVFNTEKRTFTTYDLRLTTFKVINAKKGLHHCLKVFNTEEGFHHFLTTLKVFNIEKGHHHFLETLKGFNFEKWLYQIIMTLLKFFKTLFCRMLVKSGFSRSIIISYFY